MLLTKVQEIGQRMLAEAQEIKTEANNLTAKVYDLNQQKNEWLATINENDMTVYGIALLQRGKIQINGGKIF